MAVARSSFNSSAVLYVTLFTSGFEMDDVMFSHKGETGPELKTKRMFRPVRQLVATGGAKSAVLFCMKLFVNSPLIHVYSFGRTMNRPVRYPELPGKSLKQHFRRLVMIEVNVGDRVTAVCNCVILHVPKYCLP